MNPALVGIVVFACAFAGVLLGMWLRTTLPEHHLDAESNGTVRVSIGLIVTMTALVLGLVTASAKSSFDAVDAVVKQTSSQILALDRILARYGSETGKIRESLKDAIGARIEMIWPQGPSRPVDLEVLASGGWLVGTERLAAAIQGLNPTDDVQRALQKRALDLSEGLLATRWLVTDSTAASIPAPFLAVLISWLAIIFVSFGLFAPRNASVVTVLLVCSLSVGSALFLIVELDGPFDGLLKVSPDSVRYAYAHLNR